MLRLGVIICQAGLGDHRRQRNGVDPSQNSKPFSVTPAPPRPCATSTRRLSGMLPWQMQCPSGLRLQRSARFQAPTARSRDDRRQGNQVSVRAALPHLVFSPISRP
jgi:hypothetical protein